MGDAGDPMGTPAAVIRQPARDHVTWVDDSRRWRGFEHRPDDIIISTPAKVGTTWMQGIVSSLLWPAGNAPGSRGSLSPWMDAKSVPVEQVHANLAAQTHRRFIKTHSPADCIPVFEECKYITVYRDGRDAFMSWINHVAKMRPELIEMLNSKAASEGIEPLKPWTGDTNVLFDDWLPTISPVHHLASWWPLRHEPFVCLVHYNDLTADLADEMHRIAEFLEIDVPDDLWPEAVRRCGFEEMRNDDASNDGMDRPFEGGAASFFHKGTNGRWRGVLSQSQLDRYAASVAEALEPAAAEWLEHGSLALQRRP